MKTKIILSVILGIMLISSCSHKRDTVDNFGKYALTLLNSESDATSIYIMPSDSILTKDTTLVDWMRSLNNATEFQNYTEKQIEEIKAWRKKSIELNFHSSNIEYLRTELDSVESWHSTRIDLNVYFLKDKKEHFFKLIEVYSLDKKWAAYRVTPPTNQEEVDRLAKEKRERESKKPYIPYGLYCSYGNWEYKYARPETFSNFFVTLKNTTSYDFKRVKFRVRIYKNATYEKTEVFSKVIEKSESIYAGDVVRFEIFELRDFYVGINITNKNNFSFGVEIVDAKPRPGYEDLPY